jgi:GNAT superfamily N-acetyltransferase
VPCGALRSVRRPVGTPAKRQSLTDGKVLARAIGASSRRGELGYVKGTFEAIVGGRLAPEELEVPRNVDGGFFWVGIVLVLPELQGRGVGAELLARLVTSQPGRYVADVYSDAGAAVPARPVAGATIASFQSLSAAPTCPATIAARSEDR